MRVVIDVAEIAGSIGDYLEAVATRAIADLLAFARDRTFQIASDELSIESHARFVQAVTTRNEGLRATIEITDPKQTRIEVGGSSFDIKAGLLRSARKRTSDGRPYVDVPLPFKTTKRGRGTLVEPQSFRGAVAVALDIVARGVRASQRVPGGQGIFSGMTATRGASRAEAKTFRRVSENSPADSWIYPQTKGLHAFDRVAQELEAIAPSVVTAIAAELAKGRK